MNEVASSSFIMENITVIMTGMFTLISSIVLAWFGYNQKTKDKMTDLKIEKLKNETIEKAAMSNRHIAIILGELYALLHKLEADRCFIIQPHPEHKHIFLSVALEVDRKGIAPVKDIFQNIPISDMAGFVKDMATNVWMYFDNIEKQVSDLKTQSMMFLAGSNQVAIRQLLDVRGSWIGSLVVENITPKDFCKDACKDTISNSAHVIQYILPPIL